MSTFELAHGEHLAYGERLYVWIGKYENNEPSLIFLVDDGSTVGFYGSAEAAAVNDEDRRFWRCCSAYWTGLLDAGTTDAVLNTFLHDGIRPSCHENQAACDAANAAREEAE